MWAYYPLGAATAAPFAALLNPSFEQDLTSWTPAYTGGTGQALIRTDKTTDGGKAAWYQGAAGSGYAGGVEMLLANATIATMTAGRIVTASVDIALDTPDKSQSNGELRLYWLDAANAVLSYSPGNLIRGDSKGRWFTSSVSAAGPVGTAKVQLRVWVTANQYGGVLFDNSRWDSPNV